MQNPSKAVIVVVHNVKYNNEVHAKTQPDFFVCETYLMNNVRAYEQAAWLTS